MGFDIEARSPEGEVSHYNGEATCDLFWELTGISDYFARVKALEMLIILGWLSVFNDKNGYSYTLRKAA